MRNITTREAFRESTKYAMKGLWIVVKTIFLWPIVIFLEMCDLLADISHGSHYNMARYFRLKFINGKIQ